MSPHHNVLNDVLTHSPDVLTQASEQQLANMTEQDRKETMKQELFFEMETARETMQQAKYNLEQAQQREQVLRDKMRTGHAELGVLQDAIDVGGADALEATTQWPSRARALQDTEDQLALLQKNTLPKLQHNYDKAVLECQLQEALTGKEGYLTREESEELIADATQQIQDIIEDTLAQLQASDREARAMTTTVKRASDRGVINTTPYDAPLHMGGSDSNPSLTVNGHFINRTGEAAFKIAFKDVYDNARRAL